MQHRQIGITAEMWNRDADAQERTASASRAVAQHVLVVRSPTDGAATNQAKRCGLASYAHIVDRQSDGSMSVSPKTLARPMM